MRINLSGMQKIPSDAPEHYESITKTVLKSGDRQGKIILPIKWVGGRAILYHDGEYTIDKRVVASGSSGAIYTSKEWIGSEVISFLITLPYIPASQEMNK